MWTLRRDPAAAPDHPGAVAGGGRVKRLGVRVGRVEALRPPPPPAPSLPDPSRLTQAQTERAAELQTRWLAVGVAGLTSEELEEIIALQEILVAPEPGE